MKTIESLDVKFPFNGLYRGTLKIVLRWDQNYCVMFTDVGYNTLFDNSFLETFVSKEEAYKAFEKAKLRLTEGAY